MGLIALALVLMATAGEAQPLPEPGELEALTREALTTRRGMLLDSRPSLVPRVAVAVIGAIELVAGVGLGVLFASGRQSDVGMIQVIVMAIPVILCLEGVFRAAFGLISTSLGARDRYDADEQIDRIDVELARRSQPQPGTQ